MKSVGVMSWGVGVMVAAMVAIAGPEPESMGGRGEVGRGGAFQESFAAQMVLVGMFENKQEPGMVEVTVFDKENNRSFTLRIGETDENGITLLEADYERNEAMFGKGDEVVILSMRTTDVEVLKSSELQDKKGQMEKRRISYAERRGRREVDRPRELPKPRFGGSELERKLQEPQMEAIRKGMGGTAEQPSH